MVIVGSTLADLVEYDAAHAVLRGEGRGVDLNLRDRLQDLIIVVVARRQNGAGSVLKEVAEIRQVAVDGNRVAGIPSAAGQRDPSVGSASSARQIDVERSPVGAGDPSPILGQLYQRFRIKSGILLAAFGLQERRLGGDGHLFRHRANLHGGVFGYGIHLQYDRADLQFLEARLLEANFISSGSRRDG